jgi:hypothetical protein
MFLVNTSENHQYSVKNNSSKTSSFNKWWRKPEYPERITDPGQATGKLYHLRLQVECTLFCNLQSWARTHAVLVIGLYERLTQFNLITILLNEF